MATSICVAEEIRAKNSFKDIREYLAYAEPFSVFDKEELQGWWRKPNVFVIKMLYNVAFSKRVIRKYLIEEVGLNRNAYPGFLSLSIDQFKAIIKLGGVDERLVIY